MVVLPSKNDIPESKGPEDITKLVLVILPFKPIFEAVVDPPKFRPPPVVHPPKPDTVFPP